MLLSFSKGWVGNFVQCNEYKVINKLEVGWDCSTLGCMDPLVILRFVCGGGQG